MPRPGEIDLLGVPAVDQHAHPVLAPEYACAVPYPTFFTEARAPEAVTQATETLFYRRTLRDLAEILDCPPHAETVMAARNRLAADVLAERCLRAASLSALLLDDGLDPGRTRPLAWHARFVPTFRILRLENLAEELLLGGAADFRAFVEAFRARLDPPATDVLALKSIAAYRCGLRLDVDDEDGARAAFTRMIHAVGEAPGVRPRLTDGALTGILLGHALELAARHGLPLQVHCGMGDPDLDLREASPLHLRPLLEDRRFQAVPFVLLHAAWPFTREAAWLAAVYPQVHVDLGLAIPYLSVRGMGDVVSMLLETAPTTKILYSSDASRIVELFWLGARWGRRVLGQVLHRAVEDGDLSSAEADRAADAILRRNAARLHPRLAAFLPR